MSLIYLVNSMNFFQKVKLIAAKNRNDSFKNSSVIFEDFSQAELIKEEGTESLNLIKVEDFLNIENSEVILKNVEGEDGCVIVEFNKLKKISDIKKSEEELKKNKANSIPDILA